MQTCESTPKSSIHLIATRKAKPLTKRAKALLMRVWVGATAGDVEQINLVAKLKKQDNRYAGYLAELDESVAESV